MNNVKPLDQRKIIRRNKLSGFLGFTLIESLIAVSMVLVVITAVTTVAQSSIAISSDMKINMEAQFLAKEGIEYVRNIRDSQILEYKELLDTDPTQAAALEWLGPLTSDCSDVAPCYVDLSDPGLFSSDIDSCPASGCPKLRYDTQTNRYGYGATSDWETTPYVREITRIMFTPGGGPSATEAIVTSRVWWEGRRGYQEVVYQQSLFNWIN